MKTIKIQGKEYVEVHERIIEFHKLYPNGSIETKILEMTERFITRTKVTPDVDNPERYFTGVAYEKEGASFINKTSALENCETSSCGRALGFLNIGIIGSIASANEVGNAIKQHDDKNATQNQKNFIYNLLAKKQISSADYDFTNLSGKLAGDLINELNLKRGQYNKDVVLGLLKELLKKEK